MGYAGARMRTGRIDTLKHLWIYWGFVREEEFQIASRGTCFRLREPVYQLMKLLLTHLSSYDNSIFDAPNRAPSVKIM